MSELAQNRLFLNYRNENFGVIRSPRSTQHISYDRRLDLGKQQFGIGGTLYRTKFIGWEHANASLTFAYHKKLGAQHSLSIGSGLVVLRAIIPESSHCPAITMFNLNANAGLTWTFLTDSDKLVQAGVAIFHINQVGAPFREPRFSGHLSYDLAVTKRWRVIPSVALSYQSASLHVLSGLSAEIFLSNNNWHQLYIGTHTRLENILGSFTGYYDRKLVASLGYQYKNIRGIFSYDFNLNALSNYQTGKTGPEFSLACLF